MALSQQEKTTRRLKTYNTQLTVDLCRVAFACPHQDWTELYVDGDGMLDGAKMWAGEASKLLRTVPTLGQDLLF